MYGPLKILKMDKEKLKAIQEEMVKKVIIPEGNQGYLPRKGNLIFTPVFPDTLTNLSDNIE